MSRKCSCQWEIRYVSQGGAQAQRPGGRGCDVRSTLTEQAPKDYGPASLFSFAEKQGVADRIVLATPLE